MKASKDDDDAALRARLDRLQSELRERDESRRADAERGQAGEKTSLGRAMSVGLNVFSEFAAAIVVGALIGWQADAWLGTKPWLLALFLGLGTAAGFLNLYRLAAKAQPGDGDADHGR